MSEGTSAANGYVCPTCGRWIPEGEFHVCPSNATGGGYVCGKCGKWVNVNEMHSCDDMKLKNTYILKCKHCGGDLIIGVEVI